MGVLGLIAKLVSVSVLMWSIRKKPNMVEAAPSWGAEGGSWSPMDITSFDSAEEDAEQLFLPRNDIY